MKKSTGRSADFECPLYCLEQLRIFIDITKGEAYNIREDYLWANQMKIAKPKELKLDRYLTMPAGCHFEGTEQLR